MYTAIMAARPDEPFIDEALASIDSQSLPPAAVIVVVNGPGALSSEEATRLQDLSASPTVVLQSERPSQSAAYDLALRTVLTPYVAFLDADDIWHETKQERQITRLEQQSSAQVSIGSIVNFTRDDTGQVQQESAEVARLFGACTFRKRTFEDFGHPDPDAGHFTWLYRWWSQASTVAAEASPLDEPVLYRRVHGANSWVSFNDEGRRQLLGELRRVVRNSRQST